MADAQARKLFGDANDLDLRWHAIKERYQVTNDEALDRVFASGVFLETPDVIMAYRSRVGPFLSGVNRWMSSTAAAGDELAVRRLGQWFDRNVARVNLLFKHGFYTQSELAAALRGAAEGAGQGLDFLLDLLKKMGWGIAAILVLLIVLKLK